MLSSSFLLTLSRVWHNQKGFVFLQIDMPRRSTLKITKRTVDALRVERGDGVFWDRTLAGFGVRVYATGRKVYVVQARGPSGSRRLAIGRHGDLSTEKARRLAAVAIDRIKRGEDPAPAPKPTLADLAERYLRVHVATHCAEQTAQGYRTILDRDLLPVLGGKRLDEVTRLDVAELHRALRKMPSLANRAVKILSKMFSLAEGWGWVTPGVNPCRSVRKYREGARERFLTPEEWRRLGQAMREAEAYGAVQARVIAALRLLMLTGCRRQEIVTLQWDDVDRTARELRLRKTKTGPRMVPLTPPAERVLDSIDRVEGNPWVFPARKRGACISHLQYHWNRIRDRAGLEDVRIHDLRHSYASRALALGESLTMIGRLLGHTKVATTARYAHLAHDSEKAAASRVGRSIGAHLVPGSV